MKKKIIILGLTALLGMGSLVGCLQPSAEQQQTKATRDTMEQINNELGMPYITNYYEKKTLKKIYELRDDSNLICYAYTRNEMTGKYSFITKCIGYGIPYSTQYSNPEVYNYNGTNIPQCEPNGLYVPDGLSATWIIRINEETGEQEPMYVEPEIVVTQTKLPRRLCDETSLPSDY